MAVSDIPLDGCDDPVGEGFHPLPFVCGLYGARYGPLYTREAVYEENLPCALSMWCVEGAILPTGTRRIARLFLYSAV